MPGFSCKSEKSACLTLTYNLRGIIRHSEERYKLRLRHAPCCVTVGIEQVVICMLYSFLHACGVFRISSLKKPSPLLILVAFIIDQIKKT